MDSAPVDAFRSSLFGTADLHETTAESAADVLADVSDSPAVGTSLPYEGVSLPDDVTTDFSPSDLEASRTGITYTTSAIASYGTVTIPTDTEGTELVSLYVDCHIGVVAASDLVADMEGAYEGLDEALAGADPDTPRSQVLTTGPSATADMGTLVQGVHGPDEVHIVLVEDR